MNLYSDQALVTEQIRLDLQRVGVTLAQSAEYEVAQSDFPIRQLVHRLSAYVLTDQLVGDTYSKDYYVPASWWQHFKRDHLPTISKRWPVKTRRETVTVRFERYATYPKAEVTLPRPLGSPVIVERVTDVTE